MEPGLTLQLQGDYSLGRHSRAVPFFGRLPKWGPQIAGANGGVPDRPRGFRVRSFFLIADISITQYTLRSTQDKTEGPLPREAKCNAVCYGVTGSKRPKVLDKPLALRKPRAI